MAGFEPERVDIGGVDLADAVQRWVTAQFSDGATAHALARMPGNSGLSFGFSVRSREGNQLESVVLRLAPPGVRRSDNTDVLRQVPLLAALESAGVPVAPVIWHTADPYWFGTDALAQRLLPAKPLHLVEEEGSIPMTSDGPELHLCQAATTLARVHAVDWRAELGDWSAPSGVESEVNRWWPLVEKAATPSDAEVAGRLRQLLLATAPESPDVGLFHGDYQTNNVLFDARGDLQAVIDWEIAGIGLQGLDVAWLAMMTDPEPWGAAHRSRLRFHADPADIHDWYAQARGHEVKSFDWYRALAAYRFAAIVAFNLRLHRTGRRPDVMYESLASSIRPLIDHGLSMLR